jgi:hypothetical protein
MSNEFGFRGYAELRAPKANIWAEAAMHFTFHALLAAGTILVCQALYATFLLVSLFV